MVVTGLTGSGFGLTVFNLEDTCWSGLNFGLIGLTAPEPETGRPGLTGAGLI